MHNTKIMVTKEATIERTVEALRKRFDNLLDKCGGPNRLAKRLSEFDSYFDESVGAYEVSNAKRGKAGEIAMKPIISAMELLAAATTSPISSTTAKSLQRMGITSYQPRYEGTKRLQEKISKSKKGH